MKTRRRARRLTLETLYEYDLANHDPIKVLQRRLEEQPLESTGISFATKLIKGVQEYQDRMDQLITRFAPEWPLEQMAVIDRNILRMAIFEFLIDQETPVKVAINEAVELAKIYGSDSAPRFINGVLGSLADEIDSLRDEILMTPVP
ncbi:MAG: transcription antitermination factor NusB [Anaerolineales bacterium]|nr:transcription antitermination factor NusB [Anaerolineales bacterium]MCB0010451.1 transcription antitermination factor NusB [Anaerolineales bacterium]MCB0018878.1 transcription antitermination factor NusB [Anaerolineales bacterium]MCB0029433.1 transcription antitermination factor NusB [Anaerolineales bacterium]MCB8962010.1 transcription antitermination factor NusB [Ardenticatenales bacterium]